MFEPRKTLNTTILIRTTDEEKAAIQTAARKAGMSASQFVRDAVGEKIKKLG